MLLDLAAAGLVCWRVPIYKGWIATRSGRALPLVVRDGLVAGLIFATVAMNGSWLLGGGEPTVSPSLPGIVIWLAVLGGVGIVNVLVISLVN